MQKKFSITIQPQDVGKRIDQIALDGISRSQIIKYGVFEKKQTQYPGKTKVQEGEAWEIIISLPQGLHLEPWDANLQVLYDSKTWAVVKKPYGVSVHPSPSDQSSQTMVHALLHHFGASLADHYDEIDGAQIPKLGLVHRLDKTTSGLLLIAKTNETLAYFQQHWKSVDKFYTAIVQGTPPVKGKIEAALDRDRKDRTKMAVVPDGQGKPSLTTFEKIDGNEKKSKLWVELHTGRTHQIRIHLSAIGFPIIGDELYGGAKADRILLHATKLVIPDPDNKEKKVEVECNPPGEFLV